MLTTAHMVMDRARDLARKRMPMVAVAGAEDGDVLQAVADARRNGIVGAILVGKAKAIQEKLSVADERPADYEIVEAASPKEAVALAVEQCSKGRAQILMKGKVGTADLLKSVLSPKSGLRQGAVLSHCAVLEIAGYPKLLSFTDGGVVSAPDFQQKLAIIENAARLSRMIGVDEPRIGLLGVLDEADPEFPSTVEAAALARTAYVRGYSKFVEGPLTMSTIFAGIRDGERWQSQIVGKPDVLVAHSIEEANIAVKAMILLRGAIFMGVIAGANVPLSLVSRADPPKNKLASLALAAVMAAEGK